MTRNPGVLLRASALAHALAFAIAGAGSAQELLPNLGPWSVATPESQGLDGDAIRAGLTSLPWPGNNGPYLLIANGRVVLTVGDIARTESTFSCSKFVTAMICARLVQQGRIADLDQNVPNTVPGAWSEYPGDATWRTFLTMTSDYGIGPTRLVGSRYAYNNHAVDFYGELMAQSLYGLPSDHMHVAARYALFDDIGRQDSLAFTGLWSGWFGGLATSSRDLARIGLLVLRDGVWDGKRLLPQSFVDGLFRCQIPATAQRFESAVVDENSQYNQQHVTDILDGRWSYGLWRVADDGHGRWLTAAAEGYRGKRLILFPRGSFPDPMLEVVFVALPRLNDEGPPSRWFHDLIHGAALAYEPSAEHDPSCVSVTFDDGRREPLCATLGAPTVESGVLTFPGTGQAAVADVRWRDGEAWFGIPAAAATGSSVGILLRAADSRTADGTRVVVRRRTDGRFEAVVAAEGIAVTGPPLTPAGSPVHTVRVRFRGDHLECHVDGIDALHGGVRGIADPTAGGFVSVVGDGGGAIDWLAVRADDAPFAQVSLESDGTHHLAIHREGLLQSFMTEGFAVWIDGFRVDLPLFAHLIGSLWPTIVSFGPDHLILSSRHAPHRLPAGTEVVVTLAGRNEGELLR